MRNSATVSPTTKGLETTLHKGLHQEKCYTTQNPAAGDTGAGGAGPGGTGAVGAGSGDTGRPKPYFVPLLPKVLGLPSSNGLTPLLLCPPPNQSLPPLQPASPLPAPSTYIEQTGGLTERLKPVSRSASPVHAVCTGCRVPRPRPPPVPGTHNMALLRLSSSRTVPRLLATVVIDPSFESAAASALVAELVDFAAACHLDNAASLVADSDCPPSVGGECALGKDVLEDRQEEFECFAAAVPHLVSMLIALEGDPDAPDIPTPRSYAEAITRQGVDFFQTFSPTPKMSLQRPFYGLRQAPREWHDTPRTTLATLGFAPSTADPSLLLCTNTSLPLFYILVYVHDLDFATADTQALALVKSPGTEHGAPSPCMVHQVLQRFGFWYSSPHSTPLPTGLSHLAPPLDKSVEPSGPYPELCGLPHGYTFSLGSGFVSWRSTRSSSVLNSSCEAEIYAGAMAAQ
ncbi:unnamed protein product [Closterium sp. NIES-53]